MKTSKVVFIITAILLLTNCEDFLDIRPEGTVPITGIDYTRPENTYLSVSAAYARMRSFSAHAFPYVGAFEIASDNADKGSSPEDNPPMKEIDDLTFQSTNSIINDLWIAYFDIVSGANFAIHQMPLFEKIGRAHV